MVRKLLCFLVMCGFMQAVMAEENLYEKHYRKQNEYNLKSFNPNPDTKMYVSNDQDEDNIKMLEQGYDMIGSSGFTAGSLSPDFALKHAKAIKADIVLVYSKYSSQKSSVSKLELIREAANTSGEVDAELLEEEAIQFKYYASYWAKLPMPKLGLHVVKLKRKDNISDEVIALDGLKVLAVIQGSPAAKAGLARGDVLLKIEDVTLQKPEALAQVVRQYQGQKVSVTFTRDDEAAKTEVLLGR